MTGQARNMAAPILSTAERMLDRAGALLNRLENPPSPGEDSAAAQGNSPGEESGGDGPRAPSEPATATPTPSAPMAEDTSTTVIAATLEPDRGSAPSITLSSIAIPGGAPGGGTADQATSNLVDAMSDVPDLRFLADYARPVEAAARAARAAASAAAAAAAASAANAAAAAADDASSLLSRGSMPETPPCLLHIQTSFFRSDLF